MRTAIYTYGEVLEDVGLINGVIVELQKIHHLLLNVHVRFFKEAHCRPGSVRCTVGTEEDGRYLTQEQCDTLFDVIWRAKSFQPPETICMHRVQNRGRCPNKTDNKCKYVEFVVNKTSKAKKGGSTK